MWFAVFGRSLAFFDIPWLSLMFFDVLLRSLLFFHGLMKNSDDTFIPDILMRHCDETLWWDIVIKPFFETYWSEILRAFEELWWPFAFDNCIRQTACLPWLHHTRLAEALSPSWPSLGCTGQNLGAETAEISSGKFNIVWNFCLLLQTV